MSKISRSQLSNYDLGLKNGSVAVGSFTMRDVSIANVSACGVDIESWPSEHIALTFDNLSIGGRWRDSLALVLALGPTLPICFAPYDDDPTHYVGGLTFAPRPALVDMRDWSATNGTARPWLSVMSQAAPGGWKGVSGNARVVTSSPDDAKMCEAQQGQ